MALLFWAFIDTVSSRTERWERWGRLKQEVSVGVRDLGGSQRDEFDTTLLLKAERLRRLAQRLFVSGDINLLESEDVVLRAGLPREAETASMEMDSEALMQPPCRVSSAELHALRAVAHRLTESGELGIAVRCLQEALDLSQEGLGSTSDITRAVRAELAHAYDKLGLYALARETAATGREH